MAPRHRSADSMDDCILGGTPGSAMRGGGSLGSVGVLRIALPGSPQEAVMNGGPPKGSPFAESGLGVRRDLSVSVPLIQPASTAPPSKGMNRNVAVALAFSFWSSAGRGVWAFATLSVYLKLLKGTGLSVGMAEGAQGLAQVLIAPLCGVYGDRFRRDTLLCFSGALGLVAAVILMGAVELGKDWSPGGAGAWDWMTDSVRFWFILFGLALWGAYQGAWTTGVETIYADSVAAGERSLYNVYKFAALQLASMIGPLVSVVLFAVLGNHWKDSPGSGAESPSHAASPTDGGDDVRGPVTHVFFAGLCLCVPAAIMLFFFSDDYAITDRRKKKKEEKEQAPTLERKASHAEIAAAAQQLRRAASRQGSVCSRPGSRLAQPEGGSEQRQRPGFPPLPPPPPHSAVRPEPTVREEPADRANKVVSWGGGSPDARERSTTEAGDTDPSAAEKPCLLPRHVPYVIVASDMLSGFGSGMTIKFFPLFFDEAIGLSPIGVNLIYVGLPLVLTAGSFAAQALSRHIGRVEASMTCGLVGAAALAGLWVLGRGGWPPQHRFWYTALPLYLLSTAQHCCRPLKKSILMDYVPRDQRARWNAVDSVTRFGWSGSAVAGGWVVDRWGYGASFLVTAVLQVAAAWCLGLLRPIIQREEEALAEEESPPPSPCDEDFHHSILAVEGANDSFDTDAPLLAASHRDIRTVHAGSPNLERRGTASPMGDSVRYSLSRGPRSEAQFTGISFGLTHRSNATTAARVHRAVHGFARSYRSSLSTTTAELQL